MRRFGPLLRAHAAAFRLLLAFTVVLGIGYPAVITAVAQIPGLHAKANGSLVKVNGKTVGSSLIGQSFTDSKGNPIARYFQSRPSAAGTGYDPTASSASNLGPESIVDTLPNPKVADSGKESLLTQVCARSLATGALEHVDGSRPFCTASGVGAVLAVFYSGPGYAGKVVRAVSLNEACPVKPFISTYQGVKVECATVGGDYAKGEVVPIRGTASSHPAVPADAVTASGSGLDSNISPAYAAIQVARVAAARHTSVANIRKVVSHYSAGRDLGFLGEPRVDVLGLNLALDREFPQA